MLTHNCEFMILLSTYKLTILKKKVRIILLWKQTSIELWDEKKCNYLFFHVRNKKIELQEKKLENCEKCQNSEFIYISLLWLSLSKFWVYISQFFLPQKE